MVKMMWIEEEMRKKRNRKRRRSRRSMNCWCYRAIRP
jgi:hypothetical protein